MDAARMQSDWVGGEEEKRLEKFENPSAEEVITKLKDDGDFDKLRIKIIHNLKSNENLRNNIISIVKQSAALNHPGAEKLKPRQLFDTIHQEIGNEMMGQISDGVWEIIRSSDGMKKEITETVESVYDKLRNEKRGKVPEDMSTNKQPSSDEKEAANDIIPSTLSSTEINAVCDDGEPNEPPGFSVRNLLKANIEEQEPMDQPPDPPHEEPKELPRASPQEEPMGQCQDVADDALQLSNSDPGEPLPGFSAIAEDHSEVLDGSDSDPDVPPGFGGAIHHHFLHMEVVGVQQQMSPLQGDDSNKRYSGEEKGWSGGTSHHAHGPIASSHSNKK